LPNEALGLAGDGGGLFGGLFGLVGGLFGLFGLAVCRNPVGVA
jgi:hypothetical protein